MRLMLLYLLMQMAFLPSSLGQIPNFREDIYINVNSSTLLCGETLRYAAFVYDKSTSQLSDVSKLMYVELIDKNGAAHFQHKLSLKNGQANASFFIPTSIPTGTYQLIAYTLWMRNFEDVFSLPITIVNPYESPSESLVPSIPSVNVQLFPEGGAIIPERENKVAIMVTNEYGNPIEQSFKLIDDSNSILDEVTSDVSGLATFNLTPDPTRQYQLLYEDQQGTFQFLSLNTTDRSAVRLKVTSEKDALQLTLNGGNADILYDIKIENGIGTAYTSTLKTDQSIRVNTSGWAAEVYRASAMLKDKVLSERIFALAPIAEMAFDPQVSYDEKEELSTLNLPFERSSLISVSVRKQSTLQKTNPSLVHYQYFGAIHQWYVVPQLSNSVLNDWLLTTYWRKQYSMNKTVTDFLPEFRGEILQGVVKSQDRALKEGTLVGYAITGEDYQLRISSVDSLGTFKIQLTSMDQDRKAYLSLINDTTAVSFKVEGNFLDTYPPLNFPEVHFTAKQIHEIVDRSISNQITNAYEEITPPIDSAIRNAPFIYNYEYVLDDYNRFPTMYEHFYEYVGMVSARSYNYKMNVYLDDPLPDELSALYLIDGIPTDTKRLLEFSPFRIKSFGIINKRFYYGPLVADGVVALHTFQGDLQGFEPGPYASRLDYKGLHPQGISIIKGIQYRDERIPDYYEELVWIPSTRTNGLGAHKLSYKNASKTPLELTIEGFTPSGSPISYDTLLLGK